VVTGGPRCFAAGADIEEFNGPAEADLMGRVFLQARKPDLAIKALQRGLVYDPDDPLLLITLARTYQESGRAGEALKGKDNEDKDLKT